nr:premnaspirodiene oxygenase-like [Ipomoea batatas]
MDSGGITHDTIKGVIVEIFSAGSETSSSTTVWAMSEMMKNPRVLAKAQAECGERNFEVSSSDSHVSSQRLHGRKTPQYWEDPESFIPERFEKSSIDFMGKSLLNFYLLGRGRRICPGLGFGFANALSPLAHLLFHFDWKLPSGVTAHTLDMTEMNGIAVAKKE